MGGCCNPLQRARVKQLDLFLNTEPPIYIFIVCYQMMSMKQVYLLNDHICYIILQVILVESLLEAEKSGDKVGAVNHFRKLLGKT